MKLILIVCNLYLRARVMNKIIYKYIDNNIFIGRKFGPTYNFRNFEI